MCTPVMKVNHRTFEIRRDKWINGAVTIGYPQWTKTMDLTSVLPHSKSVLKWIKQWDLEVKTKCSEKEKWKILLRLLGYRVIFQ
jgi:hypothetical protein